MIGLNDSSDQFHGLCDPLFLQYPIHNLQLAYMTFFTWNFENKKTKKQNTHTH